MKSGSLLLGGLIAGLVIILVVADHQQGGFDPIAPPPGSSLAPRPSTSTAARTAVPPPTPVADNPTLPASVRDAVADLRGRNLLIPVDGVTRKDLQDTFDDPRASGHMGSVRILIAPCAGAVAGGAGSGSSSRPPLVSGPQTPGTQTGDCVGPNCPSCVGPNCPSCVGPNCPSCVGPNCPPKACFASTGTFECDPKTGHWVYKLTVNGPGWVNTVSAASLTSGISVPGGPIPLNPANITVTGAPGATGVIEVCAFNATAAAGGKPYDCCRARVTVTIPRNACGIKK